MVAVVMPSEDIEIFCKIIKKDYKADRYVERSTNDKEDPRFHIAYGDKNTADFILTNLNIHKQHGIRVRIYPMRKTVIDKTDLEETSSIRAEMKASLNKFFRKQSTNKDKFYIRYTLNFVNFVYNLILNSNRYLKNRYPKAVIKEKILDITGRDSWLTDSMIGLYESAYSIINRTYFFFKNLKKRPFIENWNELENYSSVQIIKRKITSEAIDEVNKVNVDGINVNLLGSEFFLEVFGKNYENKKVKSKPPRASAILDTENSFEKIIEERKEAIRRIKVIQREIRKKRYEVREETNVVNNVFNLVKMTDAQIKVQKFFERHRDYLFSLNMDDEEEFIELFNRLTPTINYLRRYSEYNMTFSIDEEADLLVKKVLLKMHEDELVDKLEKLSQMKYFIE